MKMKGTNMNKEDKIRIVVVGENPNFSAEEFEAEIMKTWGDKLTVSFPYEDMKKIGEFIGKGNHWENRIIRDNFWNLEELGFDAEKLIEEMVQRTYEMGTIWIHSDEAHKYYIQHYLTMGEIKEQLKELFEEHELEEYKEEEEEEDWGYTGSDYPSGAMGYDR
tara:strand:- start:3 stop:491 length:489 start_codon:yes stop_codon:yes gene_type:complete